MGYFFKEDAYLIINILEEWFNDNEYIRSGGLGIKTLEQRLNSQY